LSLSVQCATVTSDYTQQLEQQNEELRRKLAECEAYKAACEPLFAILVDCASNLESSSKFLNECIETASGFTAKQDATAYTHIEKNLALSKRCTDMYLEAGKDLKEFQEGNWLDFYVTRSSMSST
jgi:hypothetical protein